ncbi:helix-turn-helix domain-containing protein [Gammaproteobacteria bacterium]|nr:helix-turn-helix domain-containing protein [Gammaproteobacteria bacterium]
MNDHQKLTHLIENAVEKYLTQAGTSGKLLYDFNTYFEKTLLVATLAYFDQNLTQSAKALGISRTTLYKKIETYSLNNT